MNEKQYEVMSELIIGCRWLFWMMLIGYITATFILLFKLGTSGDDIGLFTSILTAYILGSFSMFGLVMFYLLGYKIGDVILADRNSEVKKVPTLSDRLL